MSKFFYFLSLVVYWKKLREKHFFSLISIFFLFGFLQHLLSHNLWKHSLNQSIFNFHFFFSAKFFKTVGDFLNSICELEFFALMKQFFFTLLLCVYILICFRTLFIRMLKILLFFFYLFQRILKFFLLLFFFHFSDSIILLSVCLNV